MHHKTTNQKRRLSIEGNFSIRPFLPLEKENDKPDTQVRMPEGG